MTNDTREALADENAIVFWYKNYRGEEGYRRAIPISIRHGLSEWHPGAPQWLMLAFDTEKNVEREFAMADMISFAGDGVVKLPIGAPSPSAAVTDEMVKAARKVAPKFWRDYESSERQMRKVIEAAVAESSRIFKEALSPARSAGNQSGASAGPSTLAASVMTTDAASRRGEPDYDICGYRDSPDTPSGTEREALEACLRTIVCSFHRNACYPDAMDGEVDFVVRSILSTVESAALRRTVAERATEPVAWADSEGIERPVTEKEIQGWALSHVREYYRKRWTIPLYASPAAPSPAVERDDRAAADRLERLGSRLFELEEIASGATGANPMQRGIARDAIPAVEQLIAMEEAALAQPATAEETAPGFVKFVQEP